MNVSRGGARGARAFGLPGRAALTRLGGETAAGLVAAADRRARVDPAGIVVDAAAGGGGAERRGRGGAGRRRTRRLLDG
jgi:hypothetical protein